MNFGAVRHLHQPWVVGITLVACLSGVCLTGGSALAVASPEAAHHVQTAAATHGDHHAGHASAHHASAPVQSVAPLHDECVDEACCPLTASTETRVQAPAPQADVAVGTVEHFSAPAAGMPARVQVRPPGNDPGAAPAPLTC